MTQARFRYIFSSSILLLFLLTYASAGLSAQEPEPVANLELHFSNEGSAVIDVRWDAPETPVDHYSVFTGYGGEGHVRFYSVCRGTRHRVPIAMAGPYTVLVVPQYGEFVGAARTASIDVSRDDMDYPAGGQQIVFISPAPRKAVAGKSFEFVVTAREEYNQPLRYSLVEKPYGMSINAETGVVNWQPTAPGIAKATVRASVAGDPQIEAFQSWQIQIIAAEDNPLEACIRVNAEVINEDGYGLYEGKVTALRTDRLVTAAEDYGVRAGDVVCAQIEQGVATLDLAAGDYIFKAEGGSINTTWIGDVEDPREAVPVSLRCGQQSGGTNVVRIKAAARRGSGKRTVVRGRVVSESGNKGVRSLVVFQPAPGHPVPDLFGASDVYAAFTENDGSFSASLFDDVVYVAEAVSLHVDPQTELPAHANRFNGGADSPLEAPLLHPAQTEGEIQFRLRRLSQPGNSISFDVVDPVQSLSIGGTAVFQRVNRDETPWEVETWRPESASAGRTLTAYNLEAGDYVVQFVPWSAAYPVYYYSPSGPVIDIKDAKIFSIDDRYEGQFNFTTRALAPYQGILNTRGRVLYYLSGSTKTEYAHGALVYAFDEADKMIDYAVVDEHGDFSLDRLGLGRYRIAVNRDVCSAEYTAVTRDYEIFTLELPTVMLDCGVEVVSVEDNSVNASGSAGLKCYPQPADRQLHITLDAEPAGELTLQLYNITGVLQMERRMARGAGSELELNTSNLAVGMYVLHVEGAGRNERRVVLVNR